MIGIYNLKHGNMEDINFYCFTFKPIRWLCGGDWYQYAYWTAFGLESFWTRKKINTDQDGYGYFRLINQEHYGS
jgi:hypothetical protein